MCVYTYMYMKHMYALYIYIYNFYIRLLASLMAQW